MYIWVTFLNRDENNFDSATPRELFAQFDIYKQVNGITNEPKTASNGTQKGSVEEIF